MASNQDRLSNKKLLPALYFTALLGTLYAIALQNPCDFLPTSFQPPRLSADNLCEATQVAEAGGFGSQYQNIIQTWIYAAWNGQSFCVTPVTYMAHNYDGHHLFLREVNELLDLPSLPARQFYCLFVESCQPKAEGNMNFITNKKKWFDDFIKEKEHADFAKLHLQSIGRGKKQRFLQKPSGSKRAAVHVRRENSHDTEHGTRVLDDRTYCYVMRLVQAAHPGVTFLIHSQGERESFDLFLNDPRISLNLNGALNSTFTEMILADVLVMAKSSLSYAAGLLSEGEVWGPDLFWHTFPYYWKTYETSKKISADEPCLSP